MTPIPQPCKKFYNWIKTHQKETILSAVASLFVATALEYFIRRYFDYESIWVKGSLLWVVIWVATFAALILIDVVVLGGYREDDDGDGGADI